MAGLAALTQRFFGSANERRIKAIRPTVEKINALEGELERLSDDALKARTQEFRGQIAQGAKVDTLLVPAFATVREAAKRTLGQRHFDVQLIGGAVLHAGDIAEMRTGEGKTLVATLPVYLNALAGKGVHVVTVNDYLARRDSSWMGVVYEFLGLSVGVILNDMNDEARRAAYNCDITYGTNNEFGFDFLRDNMKHERAAMTQQRGHSYAIVDEVDSVLIDEARTPLIISGPLEDRSQFYHDVDGLIPQLGEDDYELDEKARTAVFTEPGNEHVETLLADDGMLKGESLYDIENVAIVHHLQQALKAHKLFRRDRDYIVRQDQVVIIDEFTGRMMAGRRYSEGLHQALEAKEKVTIQPESQTLASITFQNYFRMYDKLAGMTGTALTEAEEFADIYKLDVIEVPTNLPVARKDNDDEIYRTIGEKHAAIVELIDGCQQRGQPVLVGTTSIEKSEILANLLKKNGFRQADLDDSAALEKALSAEGGSDKNGNADGKTKENRRRKLFAVLNARYHEQEASIIALAGLPGAVTIATNMAGRGTDIQLGGNLDMRLQRELGELEEDDPQRKEIAKRIEDEILSLRKRVIEAGGLYVMGTERHESRRIDNQLRGRSGRQGDPGQSKFFLSLEDDLMRIFGSDRMDGMLRRLGLEEGEPIIHRWINKALEKAQQKVEARNFDIRKNLLKFDNVMNDQRMVVFEQRLELMDGEGIAATITDMRHDVIADVVATHVPERAYPEQWESEALYRELAETMALDIPVVEWAQEEGIDQEALRQRIEKAADAAAAQRAAQIGASSFRKLERTILLQMLDHLWREHLSNLDHLRSVVGFRGYGQRDPLQEYRTEAFSLFEKMLGDLRTNVTRQLMRIEFVPASAEMQEEGQEAKNSLPKDDIGNVKVRLANINGPAGHAGNRMDEKETGDSDARRKIGRNAPCPCGSGKKYKHCHGRL